MLSALVSVACGADPADHSQSDAASERADGGVSLDAGSEAEGIDAAADADILGQDASVLAPADGGEPGGDAAVDLADDAALTAPDAEAPAPSDAGDAAVERDAEVPVEPEPDGGGSAPTLAQYALFSDTLGDRLLLRGSDADADVASYTLTFYREGELVTYDPDADPATPDNTSSITTALAATPGEPSFFVALDLTAEFVAQIDAIEVVIHDRAGNQSPAVTAPKSAAPSVATGAACDVSGFNRCQLGSVCAPETATRYVCAPVAEARATACATARVLTPPMVTSVRGKLARQSLWDTPLGCVANDPKRQPDAVVELRLATDVRKLVLSTRNAFTTFDSQLYVLPSCGNNPPACIDERCPCADDVPATDGMPPSLQTELTLTDLSAGSYLIAIDSLPSPESSGEFELTVSIE